MLNLSFHVVWLISYATKALIHPVFPFCINFITQRTGDFNTRHPVLVLPWETKPFENKGRAVYDDLSVRDKVTAGCTGGLLFSWEEQKLKIEN